MHFSRLSVRRIWTYLKPNQHCFCFFVTWCWLTNDTDNELVNLWRQFRSKCYHSVAIILGTTKQFFCSDVRILYVLINKMSPVFSVFTQSFFFDFLPTASSLLDVFQYVTELSYSWSSHRSLAVKF